MENSPSFKQKLVTLAEKSGGLRLLQSLEINTKNRVYVLAYHRVDTFEHRPWLNPELISAAPSQFAQQMELLKRNYHPVSISDLLGAVQGTKKLPNQAVLVTVDDGYLDFQETILPTCAGLGIRPLLFVPTGYAGSGTFWWDKLYQIIFYSEWDHIIDVSGNLHPIITSEEKANCLRRMTRLVKSLDMELGIGWLESNYQRFLDESKPGAPWLQQRSTLDWDELRIISQQGADIAAHTHSHPILSRIAADRIVGEIRQSRELVKMELGIDLPVFAYPDGVPQSIGDASREIVREEKILLAFTMVSGRANLEKDALDYLPRLGPWSKQNLGSYHFRITPIYNYSKSSRMDHPF